MRYMLILASRSESGTDSEEEEGAGDYVRYGIRRGERRQPPAMPSNCCARPRGGAGLLRRVGRHYYNLRRGGACLRAVRGRWKGERERSERKNTKSRKQIAPAHEVNTHIHSETAASGARCRGALKIEPNGSGFNSSLCGNHQHLAK